MIIAVNTRFLLPTKMEGFGWYTFEIVKRIVENHPEHQFIFFFDRPFDEKFIFGPNVTPVVLSPQARHPFLFIAWFEFAVTRALKKYKGDLFFSPDGYLSLQTSVPQIAVIHDINFEHYPEDLPMLARKYLRFFFPRFARKADRILTVSEYSKKDICSTYGILPQKVKAIWNGASDLFVPVDISVQLEIRRFYAKSKSYFLYVGALHARKNIKRLLEAFVLYKKSENADLDLVIVGQSLWKNSATYDFVPEEYKKFIHFTGHLPLDELVKVTGSASIFVYPPYFEGFGIPLVEAMKCGVPIISGNLTSLPEVCGDAALYCDPMDSHDIAKKMIQLASSEEQRGYFAKKGLERAKLFDWDKSAALVWNELEDVLQSHKKK